MKWLVFQHVPQEHPGLITTFSKENNITLNVVELWKTYKIPSVLNYDALIIMGGPMGVYEHNDKYPSREDEVKAIMEGLDKIPMFGFCLGHQLIAHVLGADVYPNIQNGKRIKEVGYYPITFTSEGLHCPLFKGFTSPTEVFLWHGDVCDVPKGATLLATSSLCHNQAYSFKNLYCIQFHFEVTPDMINKLVEIDHKWLHEDFEFNEDELLQQAKQKEILMKEQSDKLLRNFINIITTK